MTTRDNFKPRLRTRERWPALGAFAGVIAATAFVSGSAAFFSLAFFAAVLGCLLLVAGVVDFVASAFVVAGGTAAVGFGDSTGTLAATFGTGAGVATGGVMACVAGGGGAVCVIASFPGMASFPRTSTTSRSG